MVEKSFTLHKNHVAYARMLAVMKPSEDSPEDC